MPTKSQTVQDALAVLSAMSSSQPGPHIEVLSAGFKELFDESVTAQVDRAIVLEQLDEFVSMMTANIPLGAPDRTYDPNDVFREVAIDRMERSKNFAGNLKAVIDPETKSDSATWAYVLGVKVADPDGWDRDNFVESWAEKITRAEFMRRLQSSTLQGIAEGSPLRVL